MALKDGKGAILMNEAFFNNIIEKCKTYNGYKSTWFNKYYNSSYGYYYSGNIISVEFDEWIRGGMNG